MEDEEEKKKARKKIRGHTDSVICLSSNPNDRSELASGSADKSVLFWDLNEMKRKSSLKSLHKDRVQSIRFHPTEPFTLLSGSADCTVRVNDSREEKSSSSSWRFENEIEKVLWVYNEDNYFLVLLFLHPN
jgi:periodic tryptophan protein 1